MNLWRIVFVSLQAFATLTLRELHGATLLDVMSRSSFSIGARYSWPRAQTRTQSIILSGQLASFRQI